MSGSVFSPTYYTVTLTNPGGSPTAPNDGFVDNTPIAYYLSASSGVETPGTGTDATGYVNDVTLAGSLAKRRANIRWQQIIANLGLIANMYTSSFSVVGIGEGTPWTPWNPDDGYPTIDADDLAGALSTNGLVGLTFTLTVERGDSVLMTIDETVSGPPYTYLTGTDAITRAIARGLFYVQSDPTMINAVFDPTAQAVLSGFSTNAVPRVGERTQPLAVGYVASSLADCAACVSIVLATGP